MKKLFLLILATASTSALLGVRPTRSQIARIQRDAARIIPVRHVVIAHSEVTENRSNNSSDSDSSDGVVIPGGMVHNFQNTAARLLPTVFPRTLPAPLPTIQTRIVNRNTGATTRPANPPVTNRPQFGHFQLPQNTRAAQHLTPAVMQAHLAAGNATRTLSNVRHN